MVEHRSRARDVVVVDPARRLRPARHPAGRDHVHATAAQRLDDRVRAHRVHHDGAVEREAVEPRVARVGREQGQRVAELERGRGRGVHHLEEVVEVGDREREVVLKRDREVLRAAGADAPVWLDTDTRIAPESFDHCLLATGGVLSAVDAVAMEAYHRPDSLFTLTRPPGHHTGPDRAMGFCLLNHVADRGALRAGDLRVRARRDPRLGRPPRQRHAGHPLGGSVVSCSCRCTSGRSYPGTGWLDEVGAGDGTGRTVNLPLPPGSGDREHLEVLDRVALPVIEAFAPQLLIVSAGQDGHAADTLSEQLVSAAGFRAMAERAAALAKRLGIGLVLVHEGGYNVSTLPALDRAILAGLGGFDVDVDDLFVPEDAPVPDGWDERLREILEVQRRHWPELR